MNNTFFASLNRYLQNARQWYETTPGRALDQAYDAVLMIQAIENEHFGGELISLDSPKHSKNTLAYFESELKKYLKIANIRLAEFKASRSFFNTANPSGSVHSTNNRSQVYASNGEQTAVILEKLKFIDDVLERYKPSTLGSLSLVPIGQSDKPMTKTESFTNRQAAVPYSSKASESDGILDKTGVLPRSILKTLDRIKRDLDPASERQVVQSFRNTKVKTVISIRFLLLLIIIPLLMQQLSKSFIIGPIVDHARKFDTSSIFLNYELEEQALKELKTFEQRVEFEHLFSQFLKPAEQTDSKTKSLAAEKSEKTSESDNSYSSGGRSQPELPLSDKAKIEKKVEEIARNYYAKSSDAIKNIFSDLLSLVAFAIVIVTNPRAIAVLKSFIDETVYGLSDSAKAFILILFTDMFVGFHSPHGWEVLLDGLAQHFGLPTDRNFSFLFIATFPVILDTIFKYWIFRYLNRISPSAVATYRNMNE